jgi:hypothetical protein
VSDIEAWFDDLASLYAFERDARRERGGLQRREADGPRRLVYELLVDVPVYDQQRNVRIEFPATSPALPGVFVDGPDDSPHRYADGSLCMYHPADPPSRRWTPTEGLAGLIDCIRAHLFQEAEARAGHGWPGDEAPHRPMTRTPTRR